MEIIKALKMRIYPDDNQKTKIDKTIGSCRYVYNQMLDRNIKAYRRRKEHLTYNNMQNLLPVMKDYLPWLKEADSNDVANDLSDISEVKENGKIIRMYCENYFDYSNPDITIYYEMIRLDQVPNATK